jgi:Gpi18-like mannosyltransferase
METVTKTITIPILEMDSENYARLHARSPHRFKMQKFQSFFLTHLEDSTISIIGIALAVLLRASLIHFENPDTTFFFVPWAEFIQNHGGFRALDSGFANYTPPYQYLLVIFTYYLFPALPKIISIKLIPIVFDFVAAFFVYKIVHLRYPRNSVPIFASLAFLFLPTVFLNSAFWGQSDVLYTTGLLAFLYFYLTDREFPAFISFGLALAIKLQGVFLLPLLLILLLNKKVSLWSFFLIPGMYLLCIIPAWLLGRPFLELLTIYPDQSAFFSSLSMNAANLYQWFSNDAYDILYPAGMILGGACIFLFVAIVYKSRLSLENGIVIELAAISVLMVPFMLPKMHDRYFYPADVISLIFGFYRPRWFVIPILIQVVSLFSYFPYLFNTEIFPFRFLSVLQLITLTLLLWYLASSWLKQRVSNSRLA